MQDSLVSSVYDITSLVRMQRQFEHEGNRLGSIYALKEWGRTLRNESRFEEALHIHSEGLRQAETQPELTIEDIAERCGFEHDSSFYHAFKKMYGITPAEFRRGRA